MQSQFTVQYGEYAVADYLSNNLKGISVFIPTSAQEKGIDLLLYKFDSGVNNVCTVQVKMSRAYYNVNKKYQNILWFNRFKPQDNAQWFIFIGFYASFPSHANAKVEDIRWDQVMLAFNNREMNEFMSHVKLKSNPEKIDKMFSFGFNTADKIMQIRGYPEERDMTPYLIENRISEIKDTLLKQSRIQLIETVLLKENINSTPYIKLLEDLKVDNIDYDKYMTTSPIDCNEELKRVEKADFNLCVALLTMLLREDHFVGCGCFEKRLKNGDVRRILERMLIELKENL